MGTNDLVKELYAEHVPGRQPILPSLHHALLAARAAGIAILDGVYNDVKDTDGFLDECRQGREMGFDGKTLIHPGQVEGANEVFAPSEQAVEDARGILEAWEAGAGSGVVTYSGRMIEHLHVESARRTLSIHDAIRRPRSSPDQAQARVSGTRSREGTPGDSLRAVRVVAASLVLGLAAALPAAVAPPAAARTRRHRAATATTATTGTTTATTARSSGTRTDLLRDRRSRRRPRARSPAASGRSGSRSSCPAAGRPSPAPGAPGRASSPSPAGSTGTAPTRSG